MSTITTNNFTELATGDTVEAKYVVHGSAKAWANLNGTGTIALRDSFGISSVVDEGTGNYTHNFTNNFANADYAGAGVVFGGSSRNINFGSTKTASAAQILSFSGASLSDESPMSVAHGDLA